MDDISIETRSLQVGSRERNYLLHAPPALRGAINVPVVLAFHGAGTHAAAMRDFCGLDEKADAAGFITVYPSGTGRRPDLLTWNAGNCCGYAQRQQVDDVAFVDAMLDDLATIVSVDPARVFAAGMSNGAMMCYRLAAQMADRIAAIAAVAGPMAMDPGQPSRPVSVIHFHGSRDEFAPYTGGIGLKSMYRASKFSVEYSIRAWVEIDGCPPTPSQLQLPDVAHDDTSVTVNSYGPGQAGSQVVLYKIEGGGHTWPGRQPALNYLGRSTANIVANDLIWEFFQRHPMT